MPSWHVLVEHTGHFLDLCEEAPVTVTRSAVEAYARWSAVGSSAASRIGGPPALDALYDVIRAKHTTAQEGGTMRSRAEGGWITQEFMYNRGWRIVPSAPPVRMAWVPFITDAVFVLARAT